MPHSRNTLLAGFSVLATAAKAAEDIPDGDCELLTLADEIRAAVGVFNTGFRECKDLEQAAFHHIHTLINRMATIPASGFSGVAAKAGWLFESLAQSGFLIPEAALAESIMADLARHQPLAVAPVVRESNRPAPETRAGLTG